MRLLFLSAISNLGGAERVLLTAVTGLRRADPSLAIRVVAPTDGPLLDAVRATGVDAEIVPMPAALRTLGDSQRGSAGRTFGTAELFGRALRTVPKMAAYVARLRAAIRRFDPHLVHSNGIKTHLLTRVAVSRHVPVVWHLHDFYGLRAVAAGLLRWGCGQVRMGIAVSRAVAADAARVLPGVRVEVVANAVDVTRFSPGMGSDLDRLAGLPPAPAGTVRVGLVATYARWKGQLTFLEAARLVSKSDPDLRVRWYVVGGPIYHTGAQFSQAELHAGASERGIIDRVGFVPFQPDPAGAYRGLDVVVHASTLPEPFGLTVAEAMACARAVVVSAAGGASELFADGVNAVGVTPADPTELAAVVKRLALDPQWRARLGIAARDTAVSRFNDADYGHRLSHLFVQVVRGASDQPT